MYYITLVEFLRKANVLFTCNISHYTMLQLKIEKLQESEIAKNDIINKFKIIVEISTILNEETTLARSCQRFPHETYWAEINDYIRIMKKLYNDLFIYTKNRLRNSSSKSMMIYICRSINSETFDFQGRFEEVNIFAKEKWKK